MFQNFKKERRWWGIISRVLMKMEAMMRSCGVIHKAVEQSLLVYSSDIWVVKGAMLNVL